MERYRSFYEKRGVQAVSTSSSSGLGLLVATMHPIADQCTSFLFGISSVYIELDSHRHAHNTGTQIVFTADLSVVGSGYVCLKDSTWKLKCERQTLLHLLRRQPDTRTT